ncbi:MAG: alpha-1,2-fucosyltransferase [Alphaproteobacteria bacterium]|nr:alpha-1,2-fucosyltransferase [Alphaproteobacteria bacterium]
MPGSPTHPAARDGTAARYRIYVQLDGRLGNQMFQYAAGRALADTRNAALVLVSPNTGNGKKPGCALDPFELGDVELVGPLIPDDPWRRRIQRITDRWFPAHSRRLGLPVIREADIRSPEQFFGLSRSSCLVGFWESPGYFDRIADRIRADFDLGRFAAEAQAETMATISARQTVAVHVRLGDLTDASRRDGSFDFCRRDYYDRARALIDRCGEDLHYLVFSDEPATARAMLSDWRKCTFVEGNSPYQDMMLMSRCRHFIIANSTFGWWGAWLGAGGESMVVAPRLWLSLNLYRANHPNDLYPEDWIVV